MTQEYVLEADLRPNGPVVKFRTVTELEEWIKKELEFWTWPEEFNRQGKHRGCVENIRNRLNEISNHVNGLKKVLPNGDSDTYRRNLLASMTKHYVNERTLLHSSLSESKHIKGMIASHPIEAAYAAGFLVRDNWLWGNGRDRIIQEQFTGAVAASLHRFGVTGAFEGQQEALRDLQTEWQKGLNDAKDYQAGFEADVEAWKEEASKVKQAQQEDFTTQMDAIQQSLDELQSKSADALAEFEKLYYEKLAMNASVTYWKEKAVNHVTLTIVFAVLVILAFVATAVGLHLTVSNIGGDLTLDKITLSNIALVAVVATIGVWLIRILVRVLLSNMHLYVDSGERVVMMQTYLALVQEDKLPEESRELILQSLFRPSSTGIVRDDAAPPFMAEWLKRTTGTDD